MDFNKLTVDFVKDRISGDLEDTMHPLYISG